MSIGTIATKVSVEKQFLLDVKNVGVVIEQNGDELNFRGRMTSGLCNRLQHLSMKKLVATFNEIKNEL